MLSESVDFLAFSFFNFSRKEVYLYLSQPVVIGSSTLFVDQVDLSHLQDLGDCWLAYIQPFAKYVVKLQAFSSSSSTKVASSFVRSDTLTRCELDCFVDFLADIHFVSL